MANQTVYPYGTNGELPSSIGIINDLTTGGADKALSAQQGRVINERFLSLFYESSSDSEWKTGNLSNGKIVSVYANKYLVVTNFPESADTLTLRRSAPDSDYYLNIAVSSDGTNYTGVPGFGKVGGERIISISGYTHVLFLLWDKPTDERAKEEVIQIYYDKGELIGEIDLKEKIFSNETGASSIKLVRELANDMWVKTLISAKDFSWEQGGINGSTGAEETNTGAVRTGWIPLRWMDQIYLVENTITGYNFFYTLYDDGKNRLGAYWSFGDITDKIRSLYSSGETGYVRLVYYKQSGTQRNIKPYDDDVLATKVKITVPFSAESSSDDVYSNPVLNLDTPDPCVVNGENGYYYMLSTGALGTKKMYRSPNLLDWEEDDSPFTTDAVSECLTDLNKQSVTFWAPEIVKIEDKYNMYLSDSSTPMLVFQSKHPYFGYEYKGKIITTSNGLSGDNIDACVRYDLDGTLWMVWGSTYGMYRQKLSADGLTLDSEDQREHIAGKLLSEDSSRATVFEGAYLYRRKGYWYLFVSAGQYYNSSYCIKVGRSTTINGTFEDKLGNEMVDGYATTILSSSSSDALYGPGHNGQIFTDKKNRTYMLFHSHYTGASSSSVRVLCLQELFWDEDGWPYFENSGKPLLSMNEKPDL